MAKRAENGRQKIEMKLIECEKARVVACSKRKKALLEYAEKLSTRTGAEVGVMLFTPGGKPCSYASTSIDEIADKFFKVKLEDRQRDLDEGKSDLFEVFEELQKETQALEAREKQRTLMYKIMHSGSEIPPNKQMNEQTLAIEMQKEQLKNEIRSAILAELLKIDLNVAPDPEEDESS